MTKEERLLRQEQRERAKAIEAAAREAGRGPLDLPYLLLVLTLVGVVLLLYGVGRTIFSNSYVKGIWPTGIGVVMVVLSLLLIAGLGGTAYYPSNADLQSSLTIANSCSSEFTLRTMFYVSLLVPFVFAYIAYVWRVMDRK